MNIQVFFARPLVGMRSDPLIFCQWFALLFAVGSPKSPTFTRGTAFDIAEEAAKIDADASNAKLIINNDLRLEKTLSEDAKETQDETNEKSKEASEKSKIEELSNENGGAKAEENVDSKVGNI